MFHEIRTCKHRSREDEVNGAPRELRVRIFCNFQIHAIVQIDNLLNFFLILTSLFDQAFEKEDAPICPGA